MKKNLAWTYDDWLGRWPSLSNDEMLRHTVVLPWPFGGRDVGDEDGLLAYRALVLVVRPWWLCRDVLDPEFRRYARWERGLTRALEPFEDDDEAWEQAYDDYLRDNDPRPEWMLPR